LAPSGISNVELGPFRVAEAKQQSLDRVACKDALVIISRLLGVIEQSRSDGSRRILRAFGGH